MLSMKQGYSVSDLYDCDPSMIIAGAKSAEAPFGIACLFKTPTGRALPVISCPALPDICQDRHSAESCKRQAGSSAK